MRYGMKFRFPVSNRNKFIIIQFPNDLEIFSYTKIQINIIYLYKSLMHGNVLLQII